MKLKTEFIEPIAQCENVEIQIELDPNDRTKNNFNLYKRIENNNRQLIGSVTVFKSNRGFMCITDPQMADHYPDKSFHFILLYFALLKIQEKGYGFVRFILDNSTSIDFNLLNPQVIKELNEVLEGIGNRYGIIYPELNGESSQGYQAYLNKEEEKEFYEDLIEAINNADTIRDNNDNTSLKKPPSKKKKPQFFSEMPGNGDEKYLAKMDFNY